MRLAGVIPLLAVALFAANAVAKPEKGKHKGRDHEAAKADSAAGEQGEEPAGAEKVGPPKVDGATWQMGPVKGDLGNAQINVPQGFAFTGVEGTKSLMRAMQNPVSNVERGTLWKVGPRGHTWFVVFEYEDTGHVKDDDKDDLDADAVLKNIQESTEAANENRKGQGWTPLHVTGWEVAPHYDEATHNLEWATKAVEEGTNEVSVNYNVRLLGRTGNESAILVAGDEQLATATPEFKGLLTGFGYTEGSRYGDYKQGDKLAEYGIAALIAGGGLAVAAKAGLLSKLGVIIAKSAKLVIVGIGALFAGIAKFFKRGGKSGEAVKKA